MFKPSVSAAIVLFDKAVVGLKKVKDYQESRLELLALEQQEAESELRRAERILNKLADIIN